MRLGVPVALSIAVLVAAACSSFSSDDTTPLDAGGVEAGADADTPDGAQVPPVDAAVDTGRAACGTVPTAVPFASPGEAVANLTSNTTHVFWVAGGTKIQRKGLSPNAIVEGVYTLATPIIAMVATSDYLVYQTTDSFSVANVADAGAPGSVGSVGAPYAVAGTGVFAYGGNLLVRTVPPAFFGGIVGHVGVSAMAGNTSFVFYIAPAPDAGAGNAVFKLANTQTSQTIGPTVYNASDRSPTELAVDGADVFMLDPDKGDVFKVPQGGGAVTVLASGEPDLGRVAVKAQQVYYSTSMGIRRVDASGAGCKATLTTDPVVNFTVAGSHVYFVSGTTILRVPQ